MIAGGSFMDGMRQGLISGGLNHGVHSGWFGSNIAAAAMTQKLRHLVGPDARAYSGDFRIFFGLGGEYEAGFIQTLRGKSGFYGYDGIAAGVGLPTMSIEAGATNLYYSGSVRNMTPDVFMGKYSAANFGVDAGLSLGVKASVAPVSGQNTKVYGFGISAGFGVSPVGGFDISLQKGYTQPYNSRNRLPVELLKEF